jgi:hypothetical protein
VKFWTFWKSDEDASYFVTLVNDQIFQRAIINTRVDISILVPQVDERVSPFVACIGDNIFLYHSVYSYLLCFSSSSVS